MGRISTGKRHRKPDEKRYQKTKRKTLDIDQIYDSIQPDKVQKTIKQQTQLDEDLPGLGQFYCLSCARYFINKQVLEGHCLTKSHKKREKDLKTKPWSVEDANLPIDYGKKRANPSSMEDLTVIQTSAQ